MGDVIKVVKVHESTLRKRLNEFGETPASQLTLDEFMNINLDAMTEEQDPPSFKAARKRDRERLLMLENEVCFLMKFFDQVWNKAYIILLQVDIVEEISELESQIEKALAEKREKMKGPYAKYAKEACNLKSKRSDKVLKEISKLTNPNISGESDSEQATAEQFITEQTIGAIQEIVNEKDPKCKSDDSVLMPPPKSISSNNKKVFLNCLVKTNKN